MESWSGNLPTYPEVGRQEVPRFMRINDNDQLEVFYLKETSLLIYESIFHFKRVE